MPRLVSLALLLLAALGLGAQARTEILITEYPPFMSAGEKPGLWCELAAAALAKEGVKAGFTAQPLDRIKAAVRSGGAVALLNSTLVIAADEASAFLVNPQPYVFAEVVIFYPAARYPAGFRLSSPKDLAGKTVGALRGTGSVAKLTEAGAILELSDDIDSMFKKLGAGRVEMVAVADIAGIEAAKRLLPDGGAGFSYTGFYQSPIDLIFSKGNPEGLVLQGKFKAGLAKIKADGSYLAIVAKYYPAGKINRNILPPELR